MDRILDRCSGLDVHKEILVATIRGTDLPKETRSFGATLTDISELGAWLVDNQITDIAMESTGVYWKPVYTVLEEIGIKVTLVNAKHIKNVPGKKTDVKDSEWLCDLLMHGLLKGSFIPPADIRDLRDLVRHRKKLIQEKTQEKNRVHKYLENSGVKIGSVLTDIFGKTGMTILLELIKERPNINKLMCGLKYCDPKKRKELEKAIHTGLNEHFKFMIKVCLDHIKFIENTIATLDMQAQSIIEDYREEVELITTVPGIKEDAAKSIVAEIGTDMSRFSSSAHLASWAGVCPGNNESAGKKKADESGKATKT